MSYIRISDLEYSMDITGFLTLLYDVYWSVRGGGDRREFKPRGRKWSRDTGS